jgi:ATP synthase protein I
LISKPDTETDNIEGSLMERRQAAFRLIGLGWYVGMCIVGGVWTGRWLDARFHTSPLLVLAGLFVGLALAFYGVYKMIQPNIDKLKGKK